MCICSFAPNMTYGSIQLVEQSGDVFLLWFKSIHGEYLLNFEKNKFQRLGCRSKLEIIDSYMIKLLDISLIYLFYLNQFEKFSIPT